MPANELLAHHRRMLAYDDWANAEALASLMAWDRRLRRRISAAKDASLRRRARAFGHARRLLAHIVAAEVLWLARLAGERPDLAVWPDLGLEECEDRFAALAQAWHEVLDAMQARDLARGVTYVNSKGQPWSSTTGDIVTHVVLHSAYHRGQIAALARGGKSEPAYTDFIHCTRNGWIEPLAPGGSGRARRRSHR